MRPGESLDQAVEEVEGGGQGPADEEDPHRHGHGYPMALATTPQSAGVGLSRHQRSIWRSSSPTG